MSYPPDAPAVQDNATEVLPAVVSKPEGAAGAVAETVIVIDVEPPA